LGALENAALSTVLSDATDAGVSLQVQVVADQAHPSQGGLHFFTRCKNVTQIKLQVENLLAPPPAAANGAQHDFTTTMGKGQVSMSIHVNFVLMPINISIVLVLLTLVIIVANRILAIAN